MILAIETATAACSAALICADGALIDERHEQVGRGHAERLLPMLEDLLAGRRPDAILVDCGPGSFTGLRVGLAAGHGLAIGWRVPLAGFSSTALLAAAHAPGPLTVALTGGHGELFVQDYGDEPLRALSPLASLPPVAAAAAGRCARVVGSGAAALVAARGHGEAVDALPRAADVRLLPAGLRGLPPRPIYGRAPDAKPMT